MDDKAQGALEYILMLGGVLVIVVMAILMLQGAGQQGQTAINGQFNTYNNVLNNVTQQAQGTT